MQEKFLNALHTLKVIFSYCMQGRSNFSDHVEKVMENVTLHLNNSGSHSLTVT